MQELKSSPCPTQTLRYRKKEAFRIIGSAFSLKELKEKLFQFFAALMDQLGETSSPTYSFLVQNALNHVRNNYQDINLSLKTLAAQMEVNAAYLGRQFALETNEYFSDYLNKIRISRAIQLLENTTWKTAAIAEAVGFANISYFLQSLKRLQGKTRRLPEEHMTREHLNIFLIYKRVPQNMAAGLFLFCAKKHRSRGPTFRKNSVQCAIRGSNPGHPD